MTNCYCKGNGPFYAPAERPCNGKAGRRHRLLTRSEIRARRQRNAGIAVCAAVALGFAALFTGAARIDAANGISVSESLANNGVHGAAAIARSFEHAEAPAVPARLLGFCGGRYMAALEESAFPADCDWIEPIRESGK